MTFQLRSFIAADAEAVNGVVLAAFSQFQAAYSDWAAFSGNLGQMVAQANTSEIIVAELEGAIVGAVAYVGPGKPKRAFFAPEWPIIRMLVVKPEHRGLGIGKALSEECIARARRDGANVVALHTSPLMNVALPMYERMGFRLEREIEPIYGVPYGVYLKHLGAQQAVPADVAASRPRG